MKRLLITGSRDWTNRDVAHDAIARAWTEWGCPSDAILVSGGARGADKLCEEIWRDFLGYDVERHPADWKMYGKRAGFVRNREMVDLGADLCLAFLMPCSKPEHAGEAPHPSHGGAMCADLAEKAGIETRRYEL